MSIKYYYLRIGLQAKDAFFGNLKQVYPRSSNLTDPFPARVLLEAERRYRKKLALEHVDKLSIFSGWHTSPLNPCYHYTLQGYNMSGWMAVMIEMEVANQGSIFSYGLRDWNGWSVRSGGLQAKHFFQPGDHVEQNLICIRLCTILLVEEVEFHQLFNQEVLDGLQIHVHAMLHDPSGMEAIGLGVEIDRNPHV
ncbi:hypothetical protein EDD18DRAFT_1102136 [Armillaria luteobubalina]|uniref:Uncharacterized protein n=1 Tax=Armillaria luteobubalina TaxID=153913 RepID=A0AA39TT40_9AGAR|nr:hypothetical protein EDD18DRAFT_1102136 [Armillaria luteobubalina]